MEEKPSRFSEYLFAQMSSDKNITVEDTIRVECTAEEPVTNEMIKNQEWSAARKWFSKNLLLILTLIGVVLGGSLGFGLRPLQPSHDVIKLLSYPGELFMRLLKLIILPLIVSSLITGSASLNARLNGRIALRTLLYFLSTSVLNAVLGILLAVTIHPGDPGLKRVPTMAAAISQAKQPGAGVMDSILDLGRNLIADNIFQATFQQAFTNYVNVSERMFNEISGSFDTVMTTKGVLQYRNGTNTLGIVVFCLIFGTILGTMGAKSKPAIGVFGVIFDVVMRMVGGVIWLTPLGICSVIAGKILSVNDIVLVMTQLGWFIATVVLGVVFYQLFIMQLIYLVFVRRNPFKLYLALVQSTVTAFATASTAAALPITFVLMEDKLKIDKRITRFVLPIGCNINMDGTAMFIAVASVFFAQTNQISLGIGQLVTVCFTATAASFSSASVPSAALVLLSMVLSAIDIPDQDVFLLFAVDWLVDRFRTTNNMLGDCYAAAIVEKLSKKELMACDSILSSTDELTTVSCDSISNKRHQTNGSIVDIKQRNATISD